MYGCSALVLAAGGVRVWRRCTIVLSVLQLVDVHMRPHASRRPQASCSSPLRTDRLGFLRFTRVRVLAKLPQLFTRTSPSTQGFVSARRLVRVCRPAAQGRARGPALAPTRAARRGVRTVSFGHLRVVWGRIR